MTETETASEYSHKLSLKKTEESFFSFGFKTLMFL